MIAQQIMSYDSSTDSLLWLAKLSVQLLIRNILCNIVWWQISTWVIRTQWLLLTMSILWAKLIYLTSKWSQVDHPHMILSNILSTISGSALSLTSLTIDQFSFLSRWGDICQWADQNVPRCTPSPSSGCVGTIFFTLFHRALHNSWNKILQLLLEWKKASYSIDSKVNPKIFNQSIPPEKFWCNFQCSLFCLFCWWF